VAKVDSTSKFLVGPTRFACEQQPRLRCREKNSSVFAIGKFELKSTAVNSPFVTVKELIKNVSGCARMLSDAESGYSSAAGLLVMKTPVAAEVPVSARPSILPVTVPSTPPSGNSLVKEKLKDTA